MILLRRPGKNVNEFIMRQEIISLFMFLFLLAEGEAYCFNDSGPGTKDLSRKPRIGLGMTLSGGSFHTFETWADTYFGDNELNIRTFWHCGGGLILDFPLSRSTRLLVNPEFSTVNLERALILSELSIQQFLSRSFFLKIGGSAYMEDFKYGGAGPSFGLGFKAGGRFSIYLQGRAFYKKLSGSGEFINSASYEVPASLVVRFDMVRTFKKIETTPEVIYEIPYKATLPEPEPVKETVPAVRQPETTVIEQNPEPVTVEPVLPDTVVPEQLHENYPVDTAVVEIQDLDTVLYEPQTDFSGYSYEDLEIILERAVKDEDYYKAEKIQNEINRREGMDDLRIISKSRLEELLQQALKAEDYLKAADIQDEINRRK